MSRTAVALHCTEKEIQQLEKWVHGAKVEKRLHQRAEIVLACLDRKTNLLGSGFGKLRNEVLTTGDYKLSF